MQNPIVDIVAGVAAVSIRWETEAEFFRETRTPGAGLGDLPEDLRQAIVAHWNEDLVAAHAAEVAALAAEYQPPPAPALTPRQLRLMLLQIGMTEGAITTSIEAMPDPAARVAALIEWNWATRYERDHPLVGQLAAALDFEPAELDALWGYAAGL
jgi:hypothetical protein